MKNTYKGKGNHSINQLEAICEAQQEAQHLSQISKQELLEALQDLMDRIPKSNEIRKEKVYQFGQDAINNAKSKPVRDKTGVYYLDNLSSDRTQENPLNHAYAINEVYDKMTNFNVYHIMEWDSAALGMSGCWVWTAEDKAFPHQAEQRVKELNQEHKELTSKL